MFIAVEGLDGVGKSASSRLLATRYGFEKIPKRTPAEADLIQRAKQQGADEYTLHVMYLACCGRTSTLVRDRLAAGEDVVIARWIGTQVAAHRFYCAQLGLRPLPLRYDLLGLAEPDLTFLLRAPDAVRAQRLHQRGPIAGNDQRSLDPTAHDLFATTIRSVCPHVVELDTAALPLESVVAAMHERITAMRA